MNDELPELDDEAQLLLAQLRAEEELPPALHAAVWERLETTAPLAAPPPKPTYLWWGVAAAAAVVLTFVGLRATTARDGTTETDDSHAVYEADGGGASGTAQPSPEALPVRPAGERDTSPPEPDEEAGVETPSPPEPTVDDTRTPIPAPAREGSEDASPAARATAAAAKTRPRAHDGHTTPAPVDDEPVTTPETISIAGEIALLKKMRAALNANDDDRVLELAAEHAKTYPEGTLAPERRGLQVIARCRSGRNGADEAAAAFLRTHSGSALVDRVRTACPNVEKSPTP